MKDRFAPRPKAMHSEHDLRALCETMRDGMPEHGRLRTALASVHPADIADAMRYLSDEEDLAVYQALSSEEAAEVLDEVDASTRRRLVEATSVERLVDLLRHLPADEAADVVGVLPHEERNEVLGGLTAGAEIRELLTYGADTAGGIMTHGYIDALMDETAGEAIARFKARPKVEPIFDVYILSADGALQGAVDLHTLLRADAGARLGRPR